MIGTRKEIVDFLLSESNDKVYELKEFNEKKRSLSANAYAWVLMSQIADKLGLTKIEVYRKYIEDKGIYRIIKIDKKATKTFIKLWSERGLGWLCDEQESTGKYTEIICYYGSSSYSRKQMSLFVEYIVDEAKGLGIPTLDERRLEELVSKWKPLL